MSDRWSVRLLAHFFLATLSNSGKLWTTLGNIGRLKTTLGNSGQLWDNSRQLWGRIYWSTLGLVLLNYGDHFLLSHRMKLGGDERFTPEPQTGYINWCKKLSFILAKAMCQRSTFLKIWLAVFHQYLSWSWSERMMMSAWYPRRTDNNNNNNNNNKNTWSCFCARHSTKSCFCGRDL